MNTENEMKTQTLLRRTTAVRKSWIKLAYHNCRRAFIVSKPKKCFSTQTFGLNQGLSFTLFCIFEFGSFQFYSFLVLQFCSFSIFQFCSFKVFRFFEFDARGAMPIYCNGVDLKTRNEKPKNSPVEPVLYSPWYSWICLSKNLPGYGLSYVFHIHLCHKWQYLWLAPPFQ